MEEIMYRTLKENMGSITQNFTNKKVVIKQTVLLYREHILQTNNLFLSDIICSYNIFSNPAGPDKGVSRGVSEIRGRELRMRNGDGESEGHEFYQRAHTIPKVFPDRDR